MPQEVVVHARVGIVPWQIPGRQILPQLPTQGLPVYAPIFGLCERTYDARGERSTKTVKDVCRRPLGRVARASIVTKHLDKQPTDIRSQTTQTSLLRRGGGCTHAGAPTRAVRVALLAPIGCNGARASPWHHESGPDVYKKKTDDAIRKRRTGQWVLQARSSARGAPQTFLFHHLHALRGKPSDL